MTRTQPWPSSLQDSVHALGAAAREAQRAYRAAVIAEEHVDLARIHLLGGRVVRHSTGYTGEHEPHLGALSRIGELQQTHVFRLAELYEETARAYAHGTAWAVQEVQSGRQPEHVALTVGADGHYLLTDIPALDLPRYVGADAVDAARRQYTRCLRARSGAEAIDSQPYIADHEAAQLHDALDAAAGLPDAAYTYGVAAEASLHFVLNTRE